MRHVNCARHRVDAKAGQQSGLCRVGCLRSRRQSPLNQRKRIFEPFYRLPGTSEREGNVGLGLALVKSINEHHGGSARCEARAGGGATFVVELPIWLT